MAGSLKAHERVIDLNPHNASSRGSYAQAPILTGQSEEAVVQLELAIRLSPDDPWIGSFHGRLSRAYYYSGSIDKAVKEAETAFNHAHHWPVQVCYTARMIRLGRKDEVERAHHGLLRKKSDISADFIRRHLPELRCLDMLVDDLRRAGLSER